MPVVLSSSARGLSDLSLSVNLSVVLDTPSAWLSVGLLFVGLLFVGLFSVALIGLGGRGGK